MMVEVEVYTIQTATTAMKATTITIVAALASLQVFQHLQGLQLCPMETIATTMQVEEDQVTLHHHRQQHQCHLQHQLAAPAAATTTNDTCIILMQMQLQEAGDILQVTAAIWDTHRHRHIIQVAMQDSQALGSHHPLQDMLLCHAPS